MGLRPRALGLLCAALLGTGALGAAMGWLGARAVEASVQRAASIAAASQGLGWVRVGADGTRLRLMGTPPSPGARVAALGLAEGLVGPARLINALAPIAAAEPPAPLRLEILRDGARVSLAGDVPAGADFRLGTALAALGPGIETLDTVHVRPVSAPPGWEIAFDDALAALSALPQARISLDTCTLSVSGEAASGGDAAALTAALSRGRGAGPPTADAACGRTVDIRAPRRVASPYRLAARRGPDGVHVMACMAETPADIARIRAAVPTLAPDAAFRCTEALGAPSADWAAVAGAALAALADLPTGGAVALTDSTVALSAPAGTDPAAFAPVAARLARALPAPFTLTAGPAPDRDPSPDPRATAAPDTAPAAWFTASRAAGAEVALGGVLGSEPGRLAVGQFAEALFGAGRVKADLSVEPALPEGWSTRVMAGLEALSLLETGALDMGGEATTLRGTAPDPVAAQKIRALLAPHAGAKGALALDIRVAPPPVLPPPADPAACLAEVADLLADAQVTFAPARADITADSAPVLDALAVALTACPGARFEIGGHTDDRGSAGLNRTLSAERAERVRDALLDRGLAPDRLVAAGYGAAEPIADNATEAGRARNRRIAVKLLAADADPAAP